MRVFAALGVLLISLCLGCSGSAIRHPSAAAPAASPVSQDRIPNFYAFRGWFEDRDSESTEIDLGKLQKITVQCDDPNLYPTHPQQASKTYHVLETGRYDHLKLKPTDAACALGGPNTCLNPDYLEYAMISDLYSDGCGNQYRAFWETLFLHRDETMGTLFSRGRTLYPKKNAEFQGEMEEGQTYPVPVNEFIFVSPIFAGDAEKIAAFQKLAAKTHRFNSRTRLFEPISR